MRVAGNALAPVGGAILIAVIPDPATPPTRPMNFPSPRDWLFSLKTFIAAMVALYLALAFELPRPYWAMATVYIVSNPFLGATRSKALYRVIGTVVGAIVAILIVPPFVEAPYFFSVIVALWTGTLLYLALNDRTARSYVFMLAGYTLPLIAFPAVTDPTTVFDIAIARTEEIILISSAFKVPMRPTFSSL